MNIGGHTMNFINQYRGLKKEIYILFFGRIVTAMGSFVYPMLTLMLRLKLGFAPTEIALTLAIFTIFSLPAAILGGKLTDKFGRKKIIIIFDLITVATFIIAGILPFSNVTIGLIFIGGLFAQMEGPAYSALVADFSKTEEREKAYSMSYLGFNLGFMLGPTLGGFLFENYINLAFIINGLSTLSSTILILLFIFEKNSYRAENEANHVQESNEYEASHGASTNIFNILRDRKVIFGILFAGSLAGAVYSLVSFLLPLNLEMLYPTQGAVYYGLLSSFNGFVVIIATPLFTVALRKMREIPKMTTGVVLFLSGLFIFGFLPGIITAFAGMFVFTVGEVINALGGSPYMTRRIPASHRGRIFGVQAIIATIVSVASQLLIGNLLERWDYSPIWLLYVGIGLIVLILYFWFYRMDQKTFPKLYNK